MLLRVRTQNDLEKIDSRWEISVIKLDYQGLGKEENTGRKNQRHN